MTHFELLHPTTLADAAAGASEPVAAAMATGGDAEAVLKAGGIDLLDLMKEGLLRPRRLVSLTQISGLDTMEPAAGGLRLGAMVTLASLAADPAVRKAFPVLAKAAGKVASPQIRAVATLGGNLLQRPRCWYFRDAALHCLRKGGGHCFALDGDNRYHAIFHNAACAIVHPSSLAVALLTLDAEVELVDDSGKARQVPVENFFVSPEDNLQRETVIGAKELLSAVILPPSPGQTMAYLRQGERQGPDWPLAEVAVALKLDTGHTCRQARIALGAAAPIPMRAAAAEAQLVGARVDTASAARAASLAMKGATPLSDNAYKVPLFEALVRRAILDAAAAA